MSEQTISSDRPDIDKLRTFVAFTYGFVLLRIFAALYEGIKAASGGTGRLFAQRIETLSLPWGNWGPESDFLLRVVTLLSLMIAYYVLVHKFGREYWYRHFVIDLCISFVIFATATSLLTKSGPSEFRSGYPWVGMTLVTGLMIFRLVLTPEELYFRSGPHGGPGVGGEDLKWRTISWLGLMGVVCLIGWFLNEPKFDAKSSLDMLGFAGTMFLGLGQVLYLLRKQRGYGSIVWLAPFMAGVVVLIPLFVMREWWPKLLLDGMVGNRHHFPVSLGSSCLALAFVAFLFLRGLDTDAVRNVGETWGELKKYSSSFLVAIWSIVRGRRQSPVRKES
jgi:hypothetical protein